MRTFLVLAILVGSLVISLSAQSTPLKFDAGLSGESIPEHFEFWEDTDNSTSLKAIALGKHQNDFQPVPKTGLNPSFSNSTFFFRLKLLPGTLEEGVIDLDHRTIRRADFLIVENGEIGHRQSSGTATMPSEKPLSGSAVAFSIPHFEEPITIYMALSSIMPLLFEPIAYSQTDWQSHLRWNDMVFAIFALLLFLAIATSLVLLLYRKEWYYFFYLCYLACFALALMFIYGYAYQVFNVAKGDWAIPMFVCLALFFLIEMYRKVILVQSPWKHLPTFLRWFAWSLLALATCWLVLGQLWIPPIILVVGTSTFLCLVILTVVVWVKGGVSMNYFLLGWVFLGFSAAVYGITMNGWADLDSRLKMAPLFGFIGEMAFFLLALNQHSNHYKERLEAIVREIRLQLEELRAVHSQEEPDQSASPQNEGSPPSFLNRYLLNPLTDREQEVLNAISEGKTNPQIAETLFISVNTVKTHVLRVYSKLEVKNRTEAALKAIEMNITRPKNRI